MFLHVGPGDRQFKPSCEPGTIAWQVAELNVPYVLMHMRGDPKTMQRMTDYTDTCLEVGQELQAQAEAAMHAGIEPWRIILDPGKSNPMRAGYAF